MPEVLREIGCMVLKPVTGSEGNSNWGSKYETSLVFDTRRRVFDTRE